MVGQLLGHVDHRAVAGPHGVQDLLLDQGGSGLADSDHQLEAVVQRGEDLLHLPDDGAVPREQ